MVVAAVAKTVGESQVNLDSPEVQEILAPTFLANVATDGCSRRRQDGG